MPFKTFEEACGALSSIKDKYKWFVTNPIGEGFGEPTIRTKFTDPAKPHDYNFCPVVTLCYDITGKKYRNWETHAAAKEIEMDETVRFELAAAADRSRFAKRQQLLDALGLKEYSAVEVKPEPTTEQATTSEQQS